jgi:O-antigen ligase
MAPRTKRLGLLASAACLAAISLNVAASLQALQSLRTIALATAFVLTGLCCAGLASLRSGRWAQVVLGAVALAGTGLALHGLHQALFVFGPAAGDGAMGEAIPEAIRARIASGRALGTLSLPATLGAFLAMSIPVTAMWVFRKNAPVSARAVAATMVAIQGAGLLATRSASALCALGVAGALVVWRLARGSRGARRRTLAISAWAIAAAGIAGAALFLALRLAGPTAADEGSGPLMLRALNWKVALAIAADSPMLGAGAGCYGIAFPALREWGMNEADFAHNSYLQILAEGGVVLGVPILIALALLARRAWRAAGTGSDATLLSLACLAFMAHNVVDFTLFLPTTGMVFACLAGLLAGAGSGRPPRAGTPVRPAALVALALAAVAVVVGSADRARDTARDLLLESRLEEALPPARRAARLNPIDPEARSLQSQILLESAAARRDAAGLGEAEKLAREAVDLDPRTPGRWRHLGRVRLARGDLVGAYLALARAVALYPIRIEYREERDALRQRIVRAADPE